MRTIIKFSVSVLVLGVVLNCGKISEKVEEKVNQKVNERIDEELKKVDSIFSNNKLDSVMKSLDTLKTKADSLKQKLEKKAK